MQKFKGIFEILSLLWFFSITRRSFFETDVFTDMGLTKPQTSVLSKDLVDRVDPLKASEPAANGKETPKADAKQEEPKKEPENKVEKQETKPDEKIDDKGEKQTAKKEDADDEPGVIEIGGKDVTTEEFQEFVAEAKKDFTDEEWDKLTDAAQFKLVSKHVNLKEGSKSLNKRNAEAAEKRKETDEKAKELGQQEVDLSAQKRSLDALDADLKRREAAINARLKEIENEKADLKKIVDKNIDDVVDDDERSDLRADKRVAKRDLEKLDKEETKTKNDLTEAVKQKLYYADGIQRQMNAMKLMDKCPELKVKGDLLKMLEDYKNDNYTGDEEDMNRANAVKDVVLAYHDAVATEGIKVDIARFYKLNKHKFSIPATTPAQTGNGKEIPKLKIESAEDWGKKVKSIFKKQKENAGAGGPAGGGGSTAKLTDAEASNQKDIAELKKGNLLFSGNHMHDPSTVIKRQ